MRADKKIGTLVAITALRSNKLKEKGSFGVAREFVSMLAKFGFSAWQMLPIQETQLEPGSSKIHVPSPYKSYGIGLDPRYLSGEFEKSLPNAQELRLFREKNSSWLTDYALFESLRDCFGSDDWSRWDLPIRDRESSAIKQVRGKFASQINDYEVLQYKLHKDFEKLKELARRNKIMLLGDFPFYIGYKSPLVWSHQDLFLLNQEKRTDIVSGLPDGPKAHFGRQIWGHPLYNWQGDVGGVLALWKLRIKYFALLFEMMRLDHAKGLFYYGMMDLNNSRNDKIGKGPGENALLDLLEYAKQSGLQMFAEDSGDRLTELRQVLHSKQIPGIRVLRFGLTIRAGKEHFNQTYANPKKYPIDTVAYTTTHDTETLVMFVRQLTSLQRKKIALEAGVEYHKDEFELTRRLREAVINSPAKLVIIPIQDWLLSDERINIPGTEREINDPNWRYEISRPVEDLSLDLL